MLSRNLTLRISTGLPLAAAAILYIFLANELVFQFITVVIGFIAYYEYSAALSKKVHTIQPSVLYCSYVLSIMGYGFYLNGRLDLGLISVSLALIIIVVCSVSKVARGNNHIFWYLFPLLWIAVPIILVYILRFKVLQDEGAYLFFFLLWIAAFNDMAAYFGGKRFGKTPLAPKVSPNKTIEGSGFGVLGALLFGLILVWFMLADIFPIWKAIVIIVFVAIASQIGDLIESKFKRFCEIKDSSGLIPGHGGLLDRVDAFLLSLPVYIILIHVLHIAD